MRTLISVILIVCFASLALADDFKTNDGKEYKNATVRRVERDGIVVSTNRGISKLYFTELPKDIRDRFAQQAATQPAAAQQAKESDKQQNVRPMELATKAIYVFVAFCFVAGNLYLFALWGFGLFRSGLTFFWILIVSDGAFFLLAAVNAVLAFDAKWVRELIGRDAFVFVFNAYQLLQPFCLLLAVVGHTICVRWIISAQRRASPTQI